MYKIRIHGFLLIVILLLIKFLFLPLKNTWNNNLSTLRNYENTKAKLLESLFNSNISYNDTKQDYFGYVIFGIEPLVWQMKIIGEFKSYCEKKELELMNFEILEIFRDKLFVEPSVRLRFKMEVVSFFSMLDYISKNTNYPFFIRQLKINQSGDKHSIEIVVSALISGAIK